MNWLYRIAQIKLSEQAAAQGVHFLIGFVAVFVPFHYHVPKFVGAIAMTGVAAVIEFWFDAKFEHQTFTENLLDFAVYLAGIASACLL